jgi:hypothetical protein
VAALVLAALLATLLLIGEQARRSARPVVVIAADGVLLRRGNGPAYPPRYETPLNAGVEASLRFARGDWLQIELAGGEVGWVSRTAAVVEEQES